ncbi:disulfide bond formation protein DsbA [Solihabitans fulvus]|uniref:2-hydroxychromene-2-carboxylate isomerase n=1 Tax=Solihabitans fulvus TaxID=1892852 RepID=A0A5B2WSD5_9PSEU|nr:DsbA family protein [Solihabitans fulvus]KAA2254455.1 disulfide bond formation protein DsbA [Solihabitans fulvus]
MKKPPRLYFSLRSPFSWMAVRQLEERLPDAHEFIEYIPFWEPDARSQAALEQAGGEFHYSLMSKAKHLYILQDTKRLAERFGYQMKWPIDIDPWWELPHLAWIKAKQLGIQREYYQAVIAARWERGEDICEPEVLRSTLANAGLPVEPLVTAVDDEEIRAEGVAALLNIYHDDVFGVPYFKIGRHRFWGRDRLEDFMAVLVPELEKAMERKGVNA